MSIQSFRKIHHFSPKLLVEMREDREANMKLYHRNKRWLGFWSLTAVILLGIC
jgi:hypothetical protein